MYEYHVDTKQKAWALWEDKLRTGWRYTPKYVEKSFVLLSIIFFFSEINFI